MLCIHLILVLQCDLNWLAQRGATAAATISRPTTTVPYGSLNECKTALMYNSCAKSTKSKHKLSKAK